MTGGYKMINFGGKALSTTAVTIDGIFDAIESAKKPLMLSGLVLNSVEKPDLFLSYAVDSGNFVFTTPYGYTVTVTDDDEVTAAAITNTKSK